jgi:ABC-type antimicrobial peptide transport system permease subunit
MRGFIKYSLLLILLTLIMLIPAPFFIKGLSVESNVCTNSANISIDEINYTLIKSHVEFFSSLNSRLTGYPGYYKATDYIASELTRYGLKVLKQNYTIVVPVSEGAWIYDNTSKINVTAYPLWPNGVVASSINTSGRIYYVKEGELEDFNNISDIQKSIILMDFNSGKNWLNAAKLGAKAVIFIEPPETDKYESLDKAASANINFPRLYVNATAGKLLVNLAEKGASIILRSKIVWKEVIAYNIMGILEGEETEDVIVISAHYDSWSVVPDISPAAEDSLGVSILLELARYFSNHKPLRTLWFVAYSGHWQGLSGANEWVKSTLLTTSKRVWFQVGLDLSSETPRINLLHISRFLSSYGQGGFWGYGGRSFATSTQFGPRFFWFGQRAEAYIGQVLNTLKKIINEEIFTPRDLIKYVFSEDGWWSTQPDFYMLDTEPALLTGALGFTIRTQYSRCLHWLTPLNDYHYIKWENVKPLTFMITAIVSGFANERSWGLRWEDVKPSVFNPISMYGVLGFVTLKGRVVEYNYSTGWYTGISSALIRMPLFWSHEPTCWPFISRFAITDSNGFFTFHGLVPYVTTTFDAWKFDEEGNIIYAVDYGFYGTAQGVSGGLSISVYPLSSESYVMIPVFRCTQIITFDMIEVEMMRRISISDFRNTQYLHFFHTIPSSLTVLDYTTKSLPIFYSTRISPDGIGEIYVKPQSKVIILFSTGTASKPSIVLVNGTMENPEGHGLVVNNSPLIIYRTAYEALKDMFYLTEKRYRDLRKFNVGTFTATNLLKAAEKYLKEAATSFSNFKYDNAYAQSLHGLALISEAYKNCVMPLYDDISLSLTFFSFLVLPFSILFQSLILPVVGIVKRITALLSTLIVIFIAYYFVHPAFSVMTNSSMAVIGVAIIIFSIIISLMLISEIREVIKRIAASRLGTHEVEKRPLSIMFYSMSLAVENMRRRPLYTTLLLITIIILTASLSSLTSVSTGYGVAKGEITKERSLYDALLIKNLYGFPGSFGGGILDVPFITFLKSFTNNYSYDIAPRVWLYPLRSYPEGIHVQILHITANKTKVLYQSPIAFLGLSSGEAEKILIGKVNGFPTFTVEDGMAPQAIIPHTLAKQLNISIGDQIEIRGLGLSFTVIGISEASFVDFLDYDGRSILPIDPAYSYDLGLTTPIYPPGTVPTSLSVDYVIIIPWKVALKLGGFISSIAVFPKDEAARNTLMSLADDLCFSTNAMVYVNYEGTASSFYKIFTFQTLGWSAIIVPLILAGLSIINFMLSSITMRKKEILIFSSLGLSPSDSFILFFTEALVYALSGAVLGYLLGWEMNSFFLLMKVLPADFIYNFSSIFVIVSISVIITATLVSAIYPAFLASKIITPSLERKWRIPTKPVGDIWEIPLPIRVTEEEAQGILSYLNEFYSGSGAIRSTYEVITQPHLDKDNISLSLEVVLIPKELNITQTLEIRAIKTEKDFSLLTILHRKSGDALDWIKRNYRLIDDLRKQILLWRSLPLEKRRKYATTR